MSEFNIWMKDLPLILRKFYKESGSIYPKTPFHGLIDTIEWLGRIPSRKPRIVQKSTELNKRILTLFETKGLLALEKLTREGGDLTPHLGDTTRSIRNRQSNKNDFFSSDWGLLHFHLGADLENKGIRVSRTRRILIARFEGDNAYFINIADHGKGFSNVWGDVSHLEIMHKNWPHILGQSKFQRENIEETRNISAQEYIKLRHAGINYPIVIDGYMYTPPGLGLNADGSQAEAVWMALKIKRELDNAEIIFRQAEPQARAILALTKNYSLGYFCPDTTTYYNIYDLSKNNHVTSFFHRLLSEITLPPSKSYKQFLLTGY